MYCLDSNIIIESFRGNPEVKSRLNNIKDYEICITPLILCELYRGAFLSKNTDKNLIIIKELLKKLTILDFDTYSCELYGRIYLQLKSIGKQTQDADLMTAAICISNNKTLITRNKKHYQNIPSLILEIW